MKENEIYQQVKKAYQAYMPDTAEVDESNLQWQRVLEACRQFPENAQILDAGCGDGRYIRNLKKYGYNHVTGIDLFDSLSDKSIKYLCGDVNNLPFNDESFEVLYAISVINYSQYPEKTLEEWKRVVKPRGVIIVTGHTRYSVFTAIRWFKRKFLFKKFPHLVNMVFHDPKKISKILESSGLEIKEENGFFISWIDRLFKVRWFSDLLDHILPSSVKFRFGYHFVVVGKKGTS